MTDAIGRLSEEATAAHSAAAAAAATPDVVELHEATARRQRASAALADAKSADSLRHQHAAVLASSADVEALYEAVDRLTATIDTALPEATRARQEFDQSELGRALARTAWTLSTVLEPAHAAAVAAARRAAGVAS